MSEKRAWHALSPSSDGDSPRVEEKRPCVGHTSDSESSPYDESTFIVDPLTSTQLDLDPTSPVAPAGDQTAAAAAAMASPAPALTKTPTSSPAPAPARPSSVRDEVIAALTDPSVVGVITNIIATQVIQRMDERFEALQSLQAQLQTQLKEKDRKIEELELKVDALEQYTRRNSIRIFGIPETKGESTDEIVQATAKSIGVTIDLQAVDRSHRVGPPQSTSTPRPIIAKLVSYRTKAAIMKQRTALKDKTASDIVCHLTKDRPAGSRSKVYINDDLTKARARLAAETRKLKKAGTIQDTWIRDGDVYIKKSDRIRKVFTITELST